MGQSKWRGALREGANAPYAPATHVTTVGREAWVKPDCATQQYTGGANPAARVPVNVGSRDKLDPTCVQLVPRAWSKWRGARRQAQGSFCALRLPSFPQLAHSFCRRNLVPTLEAEALAEGRQAPPPHTKSAPDSLHTCAACRDRNFKPRVNLMQTLDHQFVAEGVADGGLAAVGQGNRRAVGGMQSEQFDAFRQAFDGRVHDVRFIR